MPLAGVSPLSPYTLCLPNHGTKLCLRTATTKCRPTAALKYSTRTQPCQCSKSPTFQQHAAAAPSDLLYLALPALLWLPDAASAEDLSYSPGQGADVVKQVAGLAYVGLLAFWLFKVIGRRINRSKTERLSSQQDKEDDASEPAEAPVTIGAAFLGAAQASFFTYLLFLFSNSISGYFSQQQLPDQYTARNITVTFRTAIAGLAYLATFIFGANAIGLTGLSLKLLISPDDADRTAAQQKLGKQKPDDSP